MNLGFGELGDALARGSLRGVDGAIAGAAYSGGGNSVTGNVTTNVVLWPKVFVLGVSAGTVPRRLTDSSGPGCARRPSGPCGAGARRRTTRRRRCPAVPGGYQFSEADDAELAALRRAVRPVSRSWRPAPGRRTLGTGPGDRAGHPGPEPIDLPEECSTEVDGVDRVGRRPGEVSSLSEGPTGSRSRRRTWSAPRSPAPAGYTGTWTLPVDGGQYQIICRPLDDPPGTTVGTRRRRPFDAGDLRGRGSDAYFVLDVERLRADRLQVAGDEDRSRTAVLGRHALQDDVGDRRCDLTLSDYVGWQGRPMFIVEPWTRVG